MVLDGERNIGTTATPPAQAINMNNGYALGIGTPAPSMPIAAGPQWSWSANDIHLKVGNIGLADGSVQEESVNGFETALTYATNGTPWGVQYFNFPN